MEMQEIKIPTQENQLPKSGLNFHYGSIGTGPLSLVGNSFSPLAEALSDEMVVTGHDSRPKNGEGKRELLIELKDSHEKVSIETGKVFYLDYQQGEDALPHHFKTSSKETNFWVKPILIEDATVFMEAGFKKGQIEEKCEFVVSSAAKSMDQSAELSSAYGRLKTVKIWGRDVLFQLYGGDEYRLLKEKFKIEFSPATVCYVSVGEYLTFEDGKWRNCNLLDASPASPLAKVKEIGTNQATIEFWDEKGVCYPEVKRSFEQNQRAQSRGEIFSSLRFRTATQVTCLIGKRRIILKKGDWLLKTAQGWRNLKNLKELESYLSYQLRGELFIFDSIEKQDDKYFLKGRFLDEMRTTATDVSVPISSEKKVKTVKKKKKAIL